MIRRTAECVEFVVVGDGRGFDVADARRRGGLGLTSLDERVRLVGGHGMPEQQSLPNAFLNRPRS